MLGWSCFWQNLTQSSIFKRGDTILADRGFTVCILLYVEVKLSLCLQSGQNQAQFGADTKNQLLQLSFHLLKRLVIELILSMKMSCLRCPTDKIEGNNMSDQWSPSVLLIVCESNYCWKILEVLVQLPVHPSDYASPPFYQEKSITCLPAVKKTKKITFHSSGCCDLEMAASYLFPNDNGTQAS